MAPCRGRTTTSGRIGSALRARYWRRHNGPGDGLTPPSGETTMGAAAAAGPIRETRGVDEFLRAGATSPERATLPSGIGVESSGIGWRRLRERAVVRETPPDSG